MFIFLNQYGVLKEIIGENKFRSGDSKKDKIYLYWDGEHNVRSAWVKFIKADETQTTETKFFDADNDELVGKELPTEPARNLAFFKYDHTYEEGGSSHIGYKFYEITVPDEVLASATSETNLCVAIVRFVLEDGTEEQLAQAGAIPFAVEGTTKGIIPDLSINETQYNYLLKLIGNNSVVANPGGVLTETLSSVRINGINYGIDSGGSGEGDMPFKLVDEVNNKSYKLTLKVKADGKGHLEAEEQ